MIIVVFIFEFVYIKIGCLNDIYSFKSFVESFNWLWILKRLN